MSHNWISLYGDAKEINGEIIFHPRISVAAPTSSQLINPEAPPPAPHAILRSSTNFIQGTITCEMKLSDPNSRCYVGLSAQSGGEFYVGLNNLGAPYGISIWRNGEWEPVEGIGHGSNLKSERWYQCRIEVRGSTVEFYVDGIKVLAVSQQLEEGPIGLFMQGLDAICVRNFAVEQQTPECFVVMQFTEEYNALYREVIKPTCESFGYKVVRADDTYTSGLIINDIVQSIKDATIVIADITPNNPNVFYEVGYAHGIGKTTILLSDKKRDKLPFDVSGFRTLFYDNSIAGKREVEERLHKHLQQIKISPSSRQTKSIGR